MPTSFLALVFISWAAALDFRESKQPGVWFPSAMQACETRRQYLAVLNRYETHGIAGLLALLEYDLDAR